MRFLGLDDEAGSEALGGIEEAVRRELGCEFSVVHPDNFQKLIQTVAEGDWDGILLDLRLNVKLKGANHFSHMAPAVAQDLRTRMTEGEVRDVPIVLWSADDNIGRFYDADRTSHDLFDWTLRKGKEHGAGPRLVALANGYNSIRRVKEEAVGGGERLLGIAEESWRTLPNDLRSTLLHMLKLRPAHEVASFLLNDVLCNPGLVVNEQLLRVRLGMVYSHDDCWREVTNVLQAYAYGGAFAGFDRWWWWPWTARKLTDRDERAASLRMFDNRERVELVSRILEVSAVCESTEPKRRDWYLCEDTGDSMPPSEAYLLAPSPTYSWQEGRYVSFDALSESSGDQEIRLAPGEWERYLDDESPAG